MTAPRARFLLLGLLWAALLAAQAAHGPFDGYVAAHMRESGARWATTPLLLQAAGRLAPPEPSLALKLACGALLSLLPLATAWASAGAGLSAARVAAVSLPVTLLLLANLPMLSNDLYLYRMYGVMSGDLGVNPYLAAPADHFPADELLHVPWHRRPCAYGPLAVSAFELAARWGRDWVGTFWALKVTMALPWLALVALAEAWPRVAPAARPGLYAWLALSPLLLLEVAENGHLEGWLGLALLAAILALRGGGARRALAAGLAFGAACAIKSSMLVAGGALLAGVAAGGRAGRAPRALLFAGGAALALAGAYAPFWAGWRTLEGLRTVGAEALRSLGALAFGGAGDGALQAWSAAAYLGAAALGWALRRRGAPLDTAVIAALLAEAYLARTFFQPWYLAVPWIVAATPLFEGGSRPRARGLLLAAATAALAGGYGVPLLLGRGEGAQALSVLAVTLPPLAALLLARRRRSP